MPLNKISIAVCAMIIVILGTVSCKHDIPEPPTSTGGDTTGGGGTTNPGNVCDPNIVYFEQEVLPIFISNCSLSGCHDVTSRQDGIVLTSYTSIMNSGGIRPGRPRDSEIYEVITESDYDDRMPPPPRNKLSDQQIQTIYKWIQQGAQNNSCQTSVCDTATVTFNTTIKPIISTKCQGCHSSSSAQGGIDFSTYTGVKSKVDDGRLWGAINHLSGFSPMPKNGNKLSSCEISKFRIWINSGAPNN